MSRIYAPFFPGDREATEEEVQAERALTARKMSDPSHPEWERMAQEEQNLQHQWDEED